MREIIFDTETTGLDPRNGDRLVEIGCVEMVNRVTTGATFHCYLNPGRDMPAAAEAVHGLSAAFLADKPRFHEKAAEFLEFIGDSMLVAHNASFDFGFINAELEACGLEPVSKTRMIDTVALAKVRHPGAKLSLDALCSRYGIDRSHRTLHGALLDAELLADVYLAMTSGQGEIGFDALAADAEANQSDAAAQALAAQAAAAGPRPRVMVSDEERAAHEARLDAIGSKLDKPVVWRALAG